MENQKKDNKTEEILSYLHRKKKYYEKILELTEKQADAIQSNNTKMLSLITADKENYIKEIKTLDRTNILLQKELSTNNKSLTLDKRLFSLLDHLRTLITKIREYDLDSISDLHSSIKITKNKLNRLNKRKRVQQSVRYQTTQPSRFVDVIK